MSEENTDKDPNKIGAAMVKAVEKTFDKMSQTIEFNKDPVIELKNLIEYDSRWRTSGLDKFNDACFAASVSYYISKKARDDHDACGAFTLYIDRDSSEKTLKALGYKIGDGEDEELLLDNTGELCNAVADQFSHELSALGYPELVMSPIVKEKNHIAAGVEFPYKQYNYQEVQFFLWDQLTVAVDVVMEPHK